MSLTSTENYPDEFENDLPVKKKSNFFKDNWFMITTILGVIIGFGAGFGINQVGVDETAKTWISEFFILLQLSFLFPIILIFHMPRVFSMQLVRINYVNPAWFKNTAFIVDIELINWLTCLLYEARTRQPHNHAFYSYDKYSDLLLLFEGCLTVLFAIKPQTILK